MTTLTAPDTTHTASTAPSRRTLVGLALTFVVLMVVGLATSGDPQDYDTGATVLKEYDVSKTMAFVGLALSVFAGGVLVYYGAALKAAIERRTSSWSTAVIGYGFTLGGVAMLVFGLVTIWLYHAVDTGDAAAVQAITIIDVGSFPALMMLFLTAYTGVGISAYAGRSLPTWLCAVSVLLGVIAPISLGGYASFTLFPIWLIVVSAVVKLDPEPA